jgi:hypothetical protein
MQSRLCSSALTTAQRVCARRARSSPCTRRRRARARMLVRCINVVLLTTVPCTACHHALRPRPAAAAQTRCCKSRAVRGPCRGAIPSQASSELSPQLFCCRAEACSLLEQQARGTQQDTASALRGERPALSREPISDDAAAEQLLAAEEMLQAQPTMEAPKCALVEALILCRSYAAALDACARLQQDSLDAAYLKAEAEWRRGEPTIAKATLQLVCAKQSGKVDELAAFVTRLTVRPAPCSPALGLSRRLRARSAGRLGSC